MISEALHLGGYSRHHLMHFFRGDGFTFFNLFAQEIAADLYFIEGLVQLMGDAGRHFSKGGHFTGLEQLGVLLDDLRDIRRRQNVGGPILVGRRAYLHFGIKGFSALAVVFDPLDENRILAPVF